MFIQFHLKFTYKENLLSAYAQQITRESLLKLIRNLYFLIYFTTIKANFILILSNFLVFELIFIIQFIFK